jgi:predicted dehydrogenase
MAAPVRLAVIGAGLIGRRHAELIRGEPEAELAAIVDPQPEAGALAAACGAPWFPDIGAMLAALRPGGMIDGAIIATPNQLHVAHGLACVEAGLPMLVEKPIADDVAAATRLVEAAEGAGVPLLVGHHRRHNPLIAEAKRAVAAGRLGDLVSVQATCWFRKPDAYFTPAWRREKGAGPVFINLIHDVDLLRHLCGEIVSVQAIESGARRGFAVEDTAAILLRFASGALGTVNVSDIVVAPWSWEFTSGENPAYTHTAESCYLLGGTLGSLSIPYLDLWHQAGAPDWWQPLLRERLAVQHADPLVLQIRHFRAVIRGEAAPLVPGREGLATLRVIEAVKRAAASGQAVRPG